MRTRRIGMFLTGVALVVFGILHFGSGRASAAAPTGLLKYAIHWSISADWLDPATGSFPVSAHLPMYLLYDSLVKPMPDGTFTPCLAESWTVSPDAKVYEFKLRKGVKFHNGEIMTAEDVVFSFWRYKAAQAKTIHGKTDRVEAINPYLVRFHFKEPFPDFLDYLLPGVSTIGWVTPKKYVETVGDAGFKRHPIGTGPYKFVEFAPGVRLVAEGFEEFWRKVPNIKRLEFYVIPDPGTRLAMVKRSEVDIATLMQDVFYHDAKKSPGVRLFAPISPGVWSVYITSQWETTSPWSDPRVRMAASLSIDRKSLADIHHPGCDPTGTVGLPGDPFAVHLSPHPYDRERARRLLAEAGYPKGFQGGKFYPYGGNWPYGAQVANYLKAVGIDLDIVLLDRAAWIAAREGGKMKGGLFIDLSQAPTIGGRLSYLFGPTSYGKYPDIQSLWEQFQREIRPKVRMELIARVQNLIYEKNLWLPLTLSNVPAAFGPKVKGNPHRIQPLIWFTAPFEDIELER